MQPLRPGWVGHAPHPQQAALGRGGAVVLSCWGLPPAFATSKMGDLRWVRSFSLSFSHQ